MPVQTNKTISYIFSVIISSSIYPYSSILFFFSCTSCLLFTFLTQVSAPFLWLLCLRSIKQQCSQNHLGSKMSKAKGNLRTIPKLQVNLAVPSVVQLVCHFPLLNFNFRYFILSVRTEHLAFSFCAKTLASFSNYLTIFRNVLLSTALL